MKTAFVTGGSRGIGRSIALDLGKKFHVIVEAQVLCRLIFLNLIL